MAAPDGPDDVVWYEFTAEPGSGGNAVFGGHVDFVGYGPAVFWRLRELVEGDVIEIGLENGDSHRYEVTAMATVPAEATALDLFTVIGPTDHDVITLITCNGTFDEVTQTYDERLVVRAERVVDAPS